MREQVYVHYADFSGNTYTYTMPEIVRESVCRTARVPNFDNEAFSEWYWNWSQDTDMAEYDGGCINVRAIARMWYTVEVGER